MGGRGIAANALLVLGATLVAAPASAEPEPIRVAYSAPRRCPDQAAFLRALRQRTANFQLARPAEPARVFVATLALDGGSVTGRLEIRGPGAERSLREVPGKTCDEVMEALALMTALAVDPGALAASPPAAGTPAPTSSTPAARPARPAAPPAASGSFAAPASPPAASTGDLRMAPVVPSAPEARPEPAVAVNAVAPPAESTSRWRWSMGAQGATTSGISPSLGLGGVLFAEAAAPGGSPWAPVFRAGLSFSQSEIALASGTAASFRWFTGVVEACPARLATARGRLGLYPCLAVQLGALRGRGLQLDEPRSATSLWADVGPLLRARVAVSDRLSLEAQSALVVPLRRVTFDVQELGPAGPATTLFAVPALGVRAGIGVAYGFE